jgi:hypothetical protein
VLTKRKIILFFIVAAVISNNIAVPFACGFWNSDEDFAYPWIGLCLLGPPVAGVAAALLFNVSAFNRVLIGIGAAFVIYGFIFVFPSGADGYTLGLVENFNLIKNPDQVQRWAGVVLDEFENGTLEVTTNADAEDFIGGKAKLKEKDIPPQIRNLWRAQPTIGIVTITENGWITDPIRTNVAIIPALTGGEPVPLGMSHCVSFSWDHRGFLVGRPEFISKWNSSPRAGGGFYEVKPGIYAYSLWH